MKKLLTAVLFAVSLSTAVAADLSATDIKQLLSAELHADKTHVHTTEIVKKFIALYPSQKKLIVDTAITTDGVNVADVLAATSSEGRNTSVHHISIPESTRTISGGGAASPS